MIGFIGTTLLICVMIWLGVCTDVEGMYYRMMMYIRRELNKNNKQ